MSHSLANINLNRLAVFVSVVEAGSLTGAAGRLGIAKTMVSAHMKRLEAELGTSLLLRTTRRLALTQAGGTFYEAARDIVSATENAINALGQNLDQLQGVLRITAPVDYGAEVIAPFVVKLRQKHPALKFEILMGDRMFDLIGEGIDVAIRLGKLADSNHQAVQLSRLESVLVATPSFLSRFKKPKTPNDLADAPFVALSVLPQPLTWSFNGKDKKKETVQFASGISANTAHAVRAAALADGGLAMLPEFAVANDIAAGKLVRVLPAWSVPAGGVYAVFPATRYRPSKVRIFIDELKAHLGSS